VIDYCRDDFTRQAERYDVAFETVAKSSFGACRPLLKPGGAYVTTLPGPGVFLEASEAGHMRGKIVLEI
jgi:NADPH:quinone reductase-like Zn-dependent oxidoreductase